MATLGRLFPDGYRKELTERSLCPGAVVRIHCDFTTPPKTKFLVVASTEPVLLVFVINSEIPPFIQARQDLRRCQVGLTPDDYDFLDHQSFADCIDVTDAIELDSLRGQMEADYAEIYKGALSLETIQEVLNAIRQSKTMAHGTKALLINTFEHMLGHR